MLYQENGFTDELILNVKMDLFLLLCADNKKTTIIR